MWNIPVVKKKKWFVWNQNVTGALYFHLYDMISFPIWHLFWYFSAWRMFPNVCLYRQLNLKMFFQEIILSHVTLSAPRPAIPAFLSIWYSKTEKSVMKIILNFSPIFIHWLLILHNLPLKSSSKRPHLLHHQLFPISSLSMFSSQYSHLRVFLTHYLPHSHLKVPLFLMVILLVRNTKFEVGLLSLQYQCWLIPRPWAIDFTSLSLTFVICILKMISLFLL